MDSVYSTRVLAALYQRGHDIQAVIKPFGSTESRNRPIFMRSNYLQGLAGHALHQVAGKLPDYDPKERDPFHFASVHGSPCYLVGRASAKKVQEFIEKSAPDLICIAFFNQLLKPNILAIPRLGTVNAHPSLLPAYRGPSPLYWMFYDGAEVGGVSLHQVDAGEDSGDLLLQESLPIPLGIRGPDYLELISDIAARLMLRSVEGLLHQDLQGQAQGPPPDLRRARPTTIDLQLHFNRPANHVFRSVRGLSEWAPLWANFGGAVYRIHDALRFSSEQRLGADFVIHGDQISVQCQPGVVSLVAEHRKRG